jgi:hypothetical protein
MAIDYETERENRRAPNAPIPAPIIKQEPTVTTKAGNTLYANSANVREDRVEYPTIVVKKPDDEISNPTRFSGVSKDPIIVSPIPLLPIPTPIPIPTTYKVKVATPEIVLFDDDMLSAETLVKIIFEDIGGQELLSMSRHDTINGDYVSNQLIKNLTSINQEFSSKRLLSLQNTSDKYFLNFGIKLENKIPFIGNGPDGSNLYLDELKNIIIELVNLEIDEQVEVQLGIGGTIYTIVLGATES